MIALARFVLISGAMPRAPHRPGMLRVLACVALLGVLIALGSVPPAWGTVYVWQDENGEESRGHWYYRQLLGSANITGGKLFHIMTGNLSHQIEHHLFPDLPARRYPEVAGEIREICRRYGLDYNTGPLRKQLGSVARKIFRLALPPRREQSPEPVAERPDPAAVCPGHRARLENGLRGDCGRRPGLAVVLGGRPGREGDWADSVREEQRPRLARASAPFTVDLL